MNQLFRARVTLLFVGAFSSAASAADIVFSPPANAVPIVSEHRAAALYAAENEWPGVLRAGRDVQADIERVTGVKPDFTTKSVPSGGTVVMVGTVGHSALIDDLVQRGKLDVSAIAGKWESFVRVIVEAPRPGVDRALVIAGSDKRGTIYGLYDLSEQMGVSPWYWWADVAPTHRDALYATAERSVRGEPSVKYRGIFLNDEAPDLTNWIRAKFGTAHVSLNPPVPDGIANYGHEFYARIFEAILRCRGNYLWPAMWNNAFNEDDPLDAALADEFGIVMGTSHQEPMVRAQKEWDRRYLKTLGTWNYAKTPDVMENFWREGIRRNKNFESIVTMGLRGANDTEMAPGGPAANRALLEQIVDAQRKILAEEISPDLSRVPQVWCLYKEVQDYYEAGMRVPPDVTLLWAEDNWGNLRRLPTTEERARPGGAGIYYHFDYHGGPRSYQWLNTSPLPKIWEQMSLAKRAGADRIWIVNVGHFKGYELPTEYFLRLAWDTTDPVANDPRAFTRRWALREFGFEFADETTELLTRYTKFNGRRKPEQLAPDTYSLVDYHEAENVVADYTALGERADKLRAALPEAKRDAFEQLVRFPIRAGVIVNQLYLAAGKNALHAAQGRAHAGDNAAAVKQLFDDYLKLVAYFDHDLAGGRWTHFMDQPVLGYTTWRDPPTNNLSHLNLVEPVVAEAASLGVAVEGSASAWPGASGEATLPVIDAFNRQQRFIEIFNRGRAPFDYSVSANVPWIVLSATGGSVGADQRVGVTADWSRVPPGKSHATLTIAGAKGEVRVGVDVFNPASPTRDSFEGFVEAEGFVSIEPEHFSRNTPVGENHWSVIPDYGRTLSGLRADGPIDGSTTPGRDAACVEYDMHLFTAGAVKVTAITAPTLNFFPHRPLRYAVAFDDAEPQVVTLVPADFKAQNGNRAWEKSVSDNARYSDSPHTIAQPGKHTLKVWMIDPGVVLQKIVVDAGGVRPTYLGPPESFRRPKAAAASMPAPWNLSPEERRRLDQLTQSDHADMLRQLGITKLRPGRNPNPGSTNPPNYDPTRANPFPDWPEILIAKNGEKVTTPDEWWQKRRPEIAEDFEREVVGRIPANVPKVQWTVARQLDTKVGGLPVVAREVVGHVDNSASPGIGVDIKMAVVLPAGAKGPVPVLIMFGWGNMPDEPTPRFPGMVDPAAPPSPDQLIAAGWGYVSLNPASIQADNGAGLTAGIIGLVNKGQHRTPEQWGALRAWAWGAARALDYLETLPAVDAKKVGIEGVSRFGKAALVAMAFEPRFAVALVGSAGEGGTKPHRRDFGESVENLASSGAYHWIAGNFLKYAADESKFGARNAGDIPVDAHELIALCAPRPTFISYGVPEKGDALWLDQQGSFMATVAAGSAYRLLGARDLGVKEEYRVAQMPPMNTGLLEGELAWRQHDGGHEDRSNMSFFLSWANRLFKYHAPYRAADQPVMRSDRNSHLVHAQLLEKAKAGGITIYFEGDSITRRWGATDYPDFLAHWTKSFYGWNAADFAWGGDTTQNMIWRVQNGELDGVNPKVISILAGTNNIGREPGDDAKVADVTRGVTALIELCRNKAPGATIVLTAIFPRNDGPVVPTINAINAKLEKLADGKTIRWVNINSQLADSEGHLYEGMTVDRLHLSLKGYEIWANALKPIFTELLGPPAQTDTAPPPTGDPSAKR